MVGSIYVSVWMSDPVRFFGQAICSVIFWNHVGQINGAGIDLSFESQLSGVHYYPSTGVTYSFVAYPEFRKPGIAIYSSDMRFFYLHP